MERKRVQLFCEDPSRTKQSFKKDCDVNEIMKRFKNVNGQDFLTRYQGYFGGQFGDFSEIGDYRSALNQIKRAQEFFDGLPAKVRARFQNDPGTLIEFLDNPANRDEAISLGFIAPDSPVSGQDPVKPEAAGS